MAEWSEIRAALKTAMLTHVEGQPCVGSVLIDGKQVQWRSYADLTSLYAKTFVLEQMDTAPTPSRRVMFGRGVNR